MPSLGSSFGAVLGVAATTAPKATYQTNAPVIVDEDLFNFGKDVSAYPNLDPTLSLRSGAKVLSEAILRRLITPRGGLFYAPDYGTDLREYLNDEMTDDTLFAIKTDVEREAEKDERVQAADATVEKDPAVKNGIKITLAITTEYGPFQMVLGINDLTVSLLGVVT